ncbi:MAG TPA: PilZ domain-containing protein [Vicinamibacteria bacterium]|jgi:Tfp pilus assembly protein PilZ|nr:PilZ domain-containing protein [Vicinamibacteria bacterium]
MRERGALRVVPAKPVTVALEHPKRPLAYGVVANISECGSCVLTAAKFDVGEEVVLTLSFAREAQPIETPGRIVWTNDGPSGTVQYGLKFVTTFDVHVRLKQLIGNFEDEPSDG